MAYNGCQQKITPLNGQYAGWQLTAPWWRAKDAGAIAMEVAYEKRKLGSFVSHSSPATFSPGLSGVL